MGLTYDFYPPDPPFYWRFLLLPLSPKDHLQLIKRRYKEMRREAIALLGGRCKNPRCKNPRKHLEFHHLVYHGIHTKIQGALNRVIEVLHHPERFELWCKKCHEAWHIMRKVKDQGIHDENHKVLKIKAEYRLYGKQRKLSHF